MKSHELCKINFSQIKFALSKKRFELNVFVIGTFILVFFKFY